MPLNDNDRQYIEGFARAWLAVVDVRPGTYSDFSTIYMAVNRWMDEHGFGTLPVGSFGRLARAAGARTINRPRKRLDGVRLKGR